MIYSLLMAISIAVSVDLFLVCPRTQWKSNHCSIPWRWNGLPKPQADGRSWTDHVLCKNFLVHYLKPVARPKKLPWHSKIRKTNKWGKKYQGGLIHSGFLPFIVFVLAKHPIYFPIILKTQLVQPFCKISNWLLYEIPTCTIVQNCTQFIWPLKNYVHLSIVNIFHTYPSFNFFLN